MKIAVMIPMVKSQIDQSLSQEATIALKKCTVKLDNGIKMFLNIRKLFINIVLVIRFVGSRRCISK